jgi:hypothetical protein
MTTITSWDHLLNGSPESQASSDPGDFAVVAIATVRYSCGSTSEVRLERERGSWWVVFPDYRERYRSKKAALAAHPFLASK